MKIIFKKKYIWLTFILVLFLLFFVGRLILSIQEVQNTLQQQNHILEADESSALTWNSDEVERLKKEIIWLEQQLQVSRSDSCSLGINLHDSIVQVQLKGTVLIQSKILKRLPVDAFNQLNEDFYFKLFGKVSSITSEKSNTPKKPIRKIKAPSLNEVVKEDSPQTPSVNDPSFWQFQTEGGVKVVFFGVSMGKDSVLVPYTIRDIFKVRVAEFLDEPFFYSPTVFIWLSDNDVKTIYRAMPENGKVIFFN